VVIIGCSMRTWHNKEQLFGSNEEKRDRVDIGFVLRLAVTVCAASYQSL
jgi:hypothetical protein